MRSKEFSSFEHYSFSGSFVPRMWRLEAWRRRRRWIICSNFHGNLDFKWWKSKIIYLACCCHMKDWIISVYDTETNTKETSSKRNTRLTSVCKNNVPVEEEKKPPIPSAQASVPHAIVFSADAPLNKKKTTFRMLTNPAWPWQKKYVPRWLHRKHRKIIVQ